MSRDVNVQKGKQGFQRTVPKPPKEPTAAPAVVPVAGEVEGARQVQRFAEQLQVLQLGRATDRLLSGADQFPAGQTGYAVVTPGDEDQLAAAASDTARFAADRGGVMREPLAGYDTVAQTSSAGTVLWMRNFPTEGRHVVGVVRSPARDYSDVLMTVATTNETEAENVFAGACTEGGFTPEVCGICGTPIACTRVHCRQCMDDLGDEHPRDGYLQD